MADLWGPLDGLDPVRVASKEAMQWHWAALLAAQPGAFAPLLEGILGRYAQAVEALDEADLPRLWLLTQAIETSGFLKDRPALAKAQAVVKEQVSGVVEITRTALTVPDVPILTPESRMDTGRFGDIPAAMLSFVQRWTGYQDKALRVPAAELVPAVFAAFPQVGPVFLLGLLRDHPDEQGALTRILEDALGRGDLETPLMDHLAMDMFSHYARRDNVAHAKAPALMAAVLPGVSGDQAAAFERRFVRYPMGLDFGARDEVIAQTAAMIARAEDRLANPPPPRPDAVLAPSLERSFAEKHLVRNKALLDRQTADFEGWVADQHLSAARRVAVSVPTRKAYEAMAKALPETATEALRDLLAAAEAVRTAPRSLPIAKPADKAFADFGLKMLVIEELMYRQEVLTPAFDLSVFAREHLERQIDREADGYAIIPEVKRWFQALPIPPELLTRVTSLHMSSGLDGGPRFMTHLYPFWDPGSGDEPLPISAKAAADLALLPRLAKIAGLENVRLPKPVAAALAARQIELLPEDQA